MEEKKSCCVHQRSNHVEHIEQNIYENFADDQGMVFIKGGSFLMGNSHPHEGFPTDGEGPVKGITLKDFYIDRYAVTNREFKKFVNETNYVTEAEKFGWSFVFYQFVKKENLRDVISRAGVWWLALKNAYWYQPEGLNSSIEDRMDHPVVHVTWNDAINYCNWANKRLPTEAEWEYAARGGLKQKRFPWGNELTPDGKHQCNIWQGEFPIKNTAEDGYIGTAPVNSYEPNGYGIYNMSGNVWEWCSDWFTPAYYREMPSNNPKGPKEGEEKTIRGGSYLCHISYCNRYRVAARTKNTPDSSSGNMGFRCVADVV